MNTSLDELFDRTKSREARVVAARALREHTGNADIVPILDLIQDWTDDTEVRIAAIEMLAKRPGSNRWLIRGIGPAPRGRHRERFQLLSCVYACLRANASSLDVAGVQAIQSRRIIKWVNEHGFDRRVVDLCRCRAGDPSVDIASDAILSNAIVGELDAARVALTSHPEAVVRAYAAELVAHWTCGDPSDIEALRAALSDSDRRVVDKAASGLRRLGNRLTPGQAKAKTPLRRSSLVDRLYEISRVVCLDDHLSADLDLERATVGRGEFWLGEAPASEKGIRALESRLTISLPRSYREFLSVSNGWRTFSRTTSRLLPVDEVGWFSVVSADVLKVLEEVSLPETLELLKRSVQISEENDGRFVLIDSRKATGDGELEIVVYSVESPKLEAFSNFEEFVAAQTRETKEWGLQ